MSLPPFFGVVLTITDCNKTKMLVISVALNQSKRPVKGDGTVLSANIKKAQSLLAPVTEAFNTLIKIAQG